MTRQHEHHAEHGESEYTQEFWDARYGSANRIWSGQPNAQLVAQIADLPPGDALDVGSGEGADAIWLASRGWRVTAVDVSAVALDRAAREAAAFGEQIASRITWQQQDVLSWNPGSSQFDLVSAQFMHLPGPAQATMHTQLAQAVRPRGTLLIVGHVHDELHAGIGPAHRFRSAEDIAATLDPADWRVVVAAAVERPGTSTGGEPAVLTDSVLRAVRRPA